ncbi:diguanylate cyclase [Aliikangiella sp. IMCC44653]
MHHICRRRFTLWLGIALSIFSTSINAITLTQEIEPIIVNSELFLYEDTNNAESVETILSKFNTQQLSKNTASKVSFGFTTSTIWAVLPVTNNTADIQSRIVQIDNAWLDEIAIYFYRGERLLNQVALGDTVTFSSRERQKRLPSIAYNFEPGITSVIFRFKSEDPMTFPIYLASTKAAEKFETQNAYFYGALYASLIILLLYNLVLFIYLKEFKFLAYSLYLSAFSSFNFTYTGHGFWLVWPEDIFLQQWLMPTLMYGYLISSILFTLEFLQVKRYLPSLHAVKHWLYLCLLGLALLIFLPGSRSFAIMAQLTILTSMAFWMLLIGYFANKNGNPLAKFFIPAVLMGASGALVSSLATWGLIPYSQWAFRGIEIGMLLEMLLLSISLGFNFRLIQEAKNNAENNARLDPLTNLFNRRALTELVQPIWSLGARNQSTVSIMLIDLDWFKQVNDKFGHAIGDQVLKQVANALRNRLRHSDTILRWGGEEFLIFLPDTEAAEAKSLAETLRSYFNDTTINDITQITISVGVATGDASKQNLDELISLADKSLYKAKQNGRNQVVLIDAE